MWQRSVSNANMCMCVPCHTLWASLCIYLICLFICLFVCTHLCYYKLCAVTPMLLSFILAVCTLRTFVYVCICALELRDIVLAIHKMHAYIQTALLKCYRYWNKHIHILYAVFCFICICDRFVSNISSLVRSASLIYYTAIAVCVYVFFLHTVFFFFFIS